MELLVLLLYSFKMCPMLLYIYVWYKAFCKTIWFSNQMQLGFIFFGRFHTLQEFDEGKRSCRRRLAGHNRRRRRKTHPDTVVNGGSLNAGSSYLLISLLRILSNLHCSSFYLVLSANLFNWLL